MRRLKILIVDDEKYEAVLMEKCVDWQRSGFEIVGSAQSAREALALFTRMAFRAYSVFCLLMAGISLVIAGWGIKTSAMTIAGAVLTAVALLILYGTSRAVEKSRRKTYMLHLFLWGMFIFVKICLIGTIILLPLVGLVANPIEMQKAIVVDSFGSKIRETYVDQDNKDLLTGEQLKDHRV